MSVSKQDKSKIVFSRDFAVEWFRFVQAKSSRRVMTFTLHSSDAMDLNHSAFEETLELINNPEIWKDTNIIDLDAPTLEVRYSLQETQELIATHEQTTGTRFVVLQKQKNYGNPDWIPTSKGRIYWEHPSPEDGVSIPIPFDGQPFMFVGRKVMGCHQGVDKDKERKHKRSLLKRQEGESSNSNYKPRKPRISKKVNCPAQIYSLQIAKFPEYDISGNTGKDRRESAKRLKADLANDVDVGYNIYFITKMPVITDHEGHLITGEDARNPALKTKQVQHLQIPATIVKSEPDETQLLIQKCSEVSKTISEATGSVQDGPYLKGLLMTLEHLQDSVMEHVSQEEIVSATPQVQTIVEISQSHKRKYEPDNNLTIEIELSKERRLRFEEE